MWSFLYLSFWSLEVLRELVAADWVDVLIDDFHELQKQNNNSPTGGLSEFARLLFLSVGAFGNWKTQRDK